ncbi:multidrug resistance-associated protein 1 isoform X2 [Lepeophtheirus salmonis]|uniref:multidrug resistance-associated protein 1 isoform X2 n=1 Tax=Lepeophtheirus salmonis TaxID=72036 RepID=UPI001AE50701|nr:ABC transporter C family member 8-like [Lepeophtheirus salmonis]
MSFLWNHFLFSDFNKFVSTANKRNLNEGDIWGLGEKHRTFNIHEKWKRKDSCSPLCNKTALALMKLLSSEILISGLYEVFHILFTLTNPIALKMLMDYIEKERGDYLRGIYSILFLTVTGFLSSLCETHTFYHLNLSGFIMKTALMSAIYKKSLRVPHFNGGNVISLVSVDCQWLVKAIRFIHLPWSCPLQIIIAIYLLYNILGVAIVPGIIIIFILIGISFLLSLLLQKFQKSHLKKDIRLSRIMEALGHFKTIKLNCWEESIIDKIGILRSDEISVMKKFLSMQALQVFLWNCGIFIFSFSAFATFSFYSHQMSVQSIFVSAALVNTMRIPFRLLPSCISALSQGIVSIKRIDSYLNREEVDSVKSNDFSKSPRPEDGYSIQVQDCNYSIDKLKLLKNINFSTRVGELTAVVGKVGSGKSCLLAALCGELNQRGKGSSLINKDLVYVTQNIWLKSATIRDNITFGQPYNSSQYQKVVSLCQLGQDFKDMYRGDLTYLASNGSTLSGGQRQRIGFARAIYQNAQVYLMDDPLSACDSNLKAQIFHNTIGPKGFLQKKTRLLITNQSSLIPLMDRIIVIQNGTVVYEGTYDQFKSHFSSVNEFLEPDETQNEKIEEEKDSAEEVKSFEIAKKSTKKQGSFHEPPKDNYLHPALDNYDIIERRKIPFSLYKYYVLNLGTVPFIIALVGYLISQCFDVCSKLWLSRWTNLSSTNINDTNYRHIYNEDTRNMYIVVYGILGWCQSLAYFLSVLLINSRSLKASSHFHDVILRKVFGAPLNFFWSTPKGTIINRFSKDMDEADMFLPNTLKNFAYQAVKILGTLIIALIAFPITAFFIVCPLGLIFIEVVKSYLMASRFLKRTSATKLAMVLKHFGDSAVHGGTTIRCYGVESDYIDEHMSLIDEHQSVSLMEIISEAWLFLRLQLIAGTFIGILATALVFFPSEGNSSSLSALSLTSSLTVLQDIFLFTRYAAFIEKAMVSIERIKECEDLIPQDPSSGLLPSIITNGSKRPKNHQSRYYIQFEDFSGKYSSLKNASIKNFTLNVRLGEKVGVVGRTGSGKSSLILALSGLLEVEKGKIFIDGVDMSSGTARNIRKKDITVIPQDAALFKGSIRYNLDPDDRFTDEYIWSVVDQAQMKEFFVQLPGGLDFSLKENGSNISLGEKQLICCLRGLLTGSNLIIMDEATSAMTLESEERILNTYFTRFSSSTIFVIAHRIQPLLACDKILVLENGTIAEFGNPESLIKSQKSIFKSMLRRTNGSVE